MMKYNFEFDKNNCNLLKIYYNGKLIQLITCPPIDNGCDIINFEDNLNIGYNYNFSGLILLTTIDDRKLFYKGMLVTETKRK